MDHIIPNKGFFERILAIGPHPDDIELGCFGTLARFKSEGSEIAHFVASCGGVGAQEEKRRAEALASAALIGAKVYFGELPDTMIPEGHPTISYIEAVVKEFKPTCVIVNSGNDNHQDHRAVARAATSASRFVPLVMYYQTPSSNRHFVPQMYINISDTIDLKKQAVRIHESQGQNVYMADNAVEGLAGFMGLQIYHGGKSFEGFEVYQMIHY